ncbi:MAG: Rrf2 family transcriptional regulator [Lachnospiraceae bacterium]|nr:Rrf2 family transcriptional regulator [Lachnospiraceae bacterium]
MKISTKGRYSLRMMIDLAEHYEEGFVSLKDISKRQDISKKYLEQIVPFLNRSQLLTANKGHLGGYRLSRDPSKITVREILESAEGTLTPVSCMDCEPNNCPRLEGCLTLPIYKGLYDVVTGYLDSITLAKIIENEEEAFTYYI